MTCDFCKSTPAPFGFAPAPKFGIAVRRPIKTCASAACKEKARARVADLVAQKGPLARPASAAPPRPPRQGALF